MRKEPGESAKVFSLQRALDPNKAKLGTKTRPNGLVTMNEFETAGLFNIVIFETSLDSNLLDVVDGVMGSTE